MQPALSILFFFHVFFFQLKGRYLFLKNKMYGISPPLPYFYLFFAYFLLLTVWNTTFSQFSIMFKTAVKNRERSLGCKKNIYYFFSVLF